MPPVTSTPIRPTTVVPLPPPPTVPAQQPGLQQTQALFEQLKGIGGYQGLSLFGNRTIGEILFGGGDASGAIMGDKPLIDPTIIYRIAAGLSGAIMVFIAVSKLSQPSLKQVTSFTAPAQNIARKVVRRAR